MPSNKIGLRKLLQSTETAGTVVHAILLDQYGEDIYDWEPLTILYEVNDDFGVDMSTEVVNKWGAIQSAMVTDAFFKRLDAFIAICNSLTLGEPFFTMFQPATTEETLWGISEISLNREMLPFSPAIRGYIKELVSKDYTDSTMPDIFKEIIDPDNAGEPVHVRPILKTMSKSDNADKLQEYIDSELADMAYQFNQVPEMALTVKKLLNRPELTIVDDL